jgi:spore germination protein YaaH
MPLLELFMAVACLQAQPSALFYMTRDAASVKSFLDHAARIRTVSPAWYETDEQGILSGKADATVLEAARNANVQVMPLVVNPGFRQQIFHRLATNPSSRGKLIRSLVAECRLHRYIGFQLDFEGVAVADRDSLTRLASEAASALRESGYQLSIAAVPRSSDQPGAGSFSQWAFANLQGAYDLAALGKAVDFISWMTYDQHMRHTTPGPIAGYPWVVEQLDYLLRHVPKEKVSLGIPLYGRRWHAGTQTSGRDPAVQMTTISYSEAVNLAAAHKAPVQWDNMERAPWFFFYRDEVREYVFFNDDRAFAERHELGIRRRLLGFSCWVLGVEDPRIWNRIPKR